MSRRDVGGALVTGGHGRRVTGWIVGMCVAAAFLVAPQATANGPKEPLTSRDGTDSAHFGTSVAIDGATAVVGAPDQGSARTGAAYVFTRNGREWIEQYTLEPSTSPENLESLKFGWEVAISGDTIIVGAPSNEQTPIPRPGRAFVFVRTGDTWAQQAELTPSDGRDNDVFGWDVAISGDTAVVGAIGSAVAPAVGPGAAYVFTRTGDTWTERATLTPSDGSADDKFGNSVGLAGDTLVVSALNDDVGVAVDQGSAYVFTGTGSTWTEQAKLVAADGSALDGLGFSIAISDDTLVAGAFFDDIGLNPKQGSAYVFTRTGTSWTQQAKLTAPDGAAGDLFGRAVSVDGDTVVVGAQFDEPFGDTTQNQGSLYVFERAGGQWGEPTKFTAEGNPSGLLGVSVGISGRTVIGGANFTNGGLGAAYVFELPPVTRIVTIDVKPGDSKNRVRTAGNEEIAVAVLATPTFDATTVDPSTVCFGEAPPAGGSTSYQQPAGVDADCSEAHRRGHLADVDGDGDIDLVLHFEAAQTGFDSGDTTARLTGRTTSGAEIAGTDSIRTVP